MTWVRILGWCLHYFLSPRVNFIGLFSVPPLGCIYTHWSTQFYGLDFFVAYLCHTFIGFHCFALGLHQFNAGTYLWFRLWLRSPQWPSVFSPHPCSRGTRGYIDILFPPRPQSDFPLVRWSRRRYSLLVSYPSFSLFSSILFLRQCLSTGNGVSLRTSECHVIASRHMTLLSRLPDHNTGAAAGHPSLHAKWCAFTSFWTH